jgi:SAM-dependent methyltransferase
VGLELGPGDSAVSAVLAAAHGAGAFHVVDDGDWVRRDPALYVAAAQRLRGQGLPAPSLTGASFDEILRRCGAAHHTGGLRSLRELPDASVDFAYSHAVLEHVRAHEFADVMAELRRVVRPGGVVSHHVDLKDHLQDALNNLRFRSAVWEAPWFAASSGFYTNRIRFGAMIELFERAGFAVDLVDVVRWPSLPTPRARMSAPYRGLPEHDLLVRGFRVTLRPAPQ